MYVFPILSLMMIIQASFLIIYLRMFHIISKKKLIWIKIRTENCKAMMTVSQT